MQNDFSDAIFKKGSFEFIRSNDKALRLDIYRQTIFENIRNSLRIIYPGIWKLLGEECTDKIAYNFASDLANLPYELDDLGDAFPKFLETLEILPYLSDYARYEWLKNKSAAHEKHLSINLAQLVKIPPKKITKIKFIFLPSVYSFCSDFPIDQIEEIAFNPDAEPIDLKVTKTYAIINRNDVFWLEPNIWKIVAMLMQGKTIATIGDNPEDLSATIYFILNNQLVKEIQYVS